MTIEQLVNNEEFVERFEKCADLTEGVQLMKAYGVDATEQDLRMLASEDELSEDQLDMVAGGAGLRVSVWGRIVKQETPTSKRFCISVVAKVTRYN